MRVNKTSKYCGYSEQRESKNRNVHNSNPDKDNNIHKSFSEVLKKAKQKTY